MDDEYLSLEKVDYETWLTPREAVFALITLGQNVSVDAINTHASEGQLRVAARVLIKRESSQTEEDGFVIVPPWLWKEIPAIHVNNMWHSGNVDISLSHPYGRGPDSKYRLLGLRFDPVGIEQIERDSGLVPRQSPTPTADPPQSVDKPFPAVAEVERFCRALMSEWPNSTVEEARAKAKLWFPDNSVSRDKFRAIFRAIQGARSPGKRPKADG